MYVLDANVFINAHRDYYSFDLAPGFWDRLINLAGQNALCSIDRIQQEIISPSETDPDELHAWSAEKFCEHFHNTDAFDVIKEYTEIQKWALQNPRFKDAAKEEFARNADAWLVAYAKAKNYTLVTHEAYNAETRKRILIPVVCREFGVPYVNTFEMLRQLQVTI
ncbi:DUF4411 family protein [Neobacillus sp. 114]|uniref:DUF4411 family protein n=1 Tax=Neobacillus sp. 114 TaxID=3048535 RepID=UPI0024C3CED4|nr:DUF4411 family protein [Neobacillus sp. 114]